MGYDFYRQLEWMDFQNLARDVIQIREGFFFESFKAGADHGIDGRFCNEDGTTILQAKNYGEYRALKQTLKKELEKVRALQPQRYLLVVSIPLSEGQKEELLRLFEGYIKRPRDLVTADDLNNYLASPQYEKVVFNYPKLWTANGGAALRECMREAIHRGIKEESRRQYELAEATRKTFVPTGIYRDVVNMLKNRRCVVISGQPGAGKTTLARILLLYHMEVLHFEEFLWATSSVKEIKDLYAPGRKQVFVVDDIWGQVFYAEKRHDIEMSCLEQLLSLMKSDRNKVLIITTREYIYQQATAGYSVMRATLDRYKLICSVDTYTDAEKASILFSHLYNADLAYPYLLPIYHQTRRIVQMPDYNPRVIDLFLQNNDPWNDRPIEFAQRLIETLRKPYAFWKDIFDRLTEEARLVALIAFISQGEREPVGMEALETAYDHCLNQMKHPPNNARRFLACISELDKTILEIGPYYQDGEEQVVRFRTPAAQDFLLEVLRENKNYYGPILLDGVRYCNQLVFLMDAKKLNLPEELYEKALRLFLERFDRWEFSWPFEVDENYGDVGEVELGKSLLYRCALLLHLHEKRPREESFTFLETMIKRYRSMLKNGDELSYGDMLSYPFLAGNCKRIGVVFEDEQSLVEEYFQRCFLAPHFYAVCNFQTEFPDAVAQTLHRHRKWLRANLEHIVWDTVDYFEWHGMYEPLNTMLELELPDIFASLGVRYTQRFYWELRGELECYVAMPESLQEKENRRESQASLEDDRWKEYKDQEKKREMQLDEAMERGFAMLLQHGTQCLEEEDQARAVENRPFSPAITE